MPRKAVVSSHAAPVGPYSHAVDSQGIIYVSGQTPIDPATGKLVQGDMATQARQCFANLFAVLGSAGLDADAVEKVTVFLTDMNDFQAMNEVYRQQFTEPFPARTTIGVAALPLNARIEIELIARRR